MSADNDREEKLAELEEYRANRVGGFIQWLAWAVGIGRHWAELKVEDGARLGADVLMAVIKQYSKEIFRIVLTDDLEERLTGQSTALSGGQSVSNLVTRLLAVREEVTPDKLAEFGLEGMDFMARDRLCDTLNAVLFRPDVGLSPELRLVLQKDLLKALEAIGDTEQFKDALKEAVRTGRYKALAELLDRQEVDAEPEDGTEAEPEEGSEAEADRVPELSVIHIAPSGTGGSDDDDPGPLAA